jgi:hypothetical protein
LELRLDAWDAAAFDDLKQLEYANGEVDGAVEKEIAPSTSPFAYSSCFKSSNAAASQASSRSSKPRRHW